jgi:peptidyl-prolyl cis-trans isomerase C
MKILRLTRVATVGLMLGGIFGVSLALTPVTAQTLPAGSFATVNGQPLTDALLDVNVRTNVLRGQPDTPQLRQAIVNELIGREILAQEALKLKLEQTPEAKVQWQQMQQNFLANLVLAHFANTNPVSQAQIKAEYDQFLKNVADAKQYKLSLIVVPTEARARAIITELNKSKDSGLFAKIAESESTDPSQANRGELEWLLTEQLLPGVGNVVANLSKGRISAVPIQTPGGWNVIRVDDVRDFTPPPMQEIEGQLRQAAAQNQLSAYIETLQTQAQIVR